jgi:hypothetical protein
MPNAIAVIAIFIIGAEILLLWSLVVRSRLAMKCSKFKEIEFEIVANIHKVFGPR